MKKLTTFILVIIVMMTVAIIDKVYARGGGERGGGGSHGGSARERESTRPGGASGEARARAPAGYSGGGDANRNRGNENMNRNAIDRTPTMSRSNTWGPSVAPKAPGQQSNLLSQQKSQFTSPQSGNATRSQLQQFLGQGQGQASAQNRVDPGSINPGRVDPGRVPNRMINSNQIRQGINQAYPNRGSWFGDQFNADHNYHPLYAADARQDMWAASSWGNLNSLWGGAVAPLYYDGGVAYNPPVNSADTSAPSSYNNQPAQQTYQSQPTYQPTDQSTSQVASTTGADWLPLGVFALSNSQNAETQPTMYFQMAVNKEGTIAGSYYNQPTDQVFPIEGLVDKSSQKAVWKMSQGDNSPTFQTGVYNLTLQETPVSVNFGDQAQNWQMIRVNKT